MISVNQTLACPVCKGTHEVIARLDALPAVACSSVTPVGTSRAFPRMHLIVLGAGIGVDSDPPKDTQSPAAVAAEIARLESEANKRKAADNIAKQAAADLKRLAELQKQAGAEA